MKAQTQQPRTTAPATSKERTLGVRLGDLTADVDAFEASTGVPMGTVVKELVSSVIRQWKEHDEIKFPMTAVPRKEYEALLLLTGQGQGPGHAKHAAPHRLNESATAQPWGGSKKRAS